MLRIFCFQFLKQFVHRIFKIFILFPRLTGVDKFQKGRKILFFLRRFIPDISDQSCIQKPLSFDPEIFRRFLPFPLGIGDDRIHQFQDILLRADIMEGVIMHGFAEIDGVQHLDLISVVHQHPAAFHNDRAFRIRHNIGNMVRHLHQLRFHIEPGFS